MVPDGLSRSSLSAASSASISSSRGPAARNKRSPSLGRRDATRGAGQQAEAEPRLKPAEVWLSADCETPSCAAARVKLRSRATARKATISLRFVAGHSEDQLIGSCGF